MPPMWENKDPFPRLLLLKGSSISIHALIHTNHGMSLKIQHYLTTVGYNSDVKLYIMA